MRCTVTLGCTLRATGLENVWKINRYSHFEVGNVKVVVQTH
jgi:hypothetical protein